MIDYVQLTPMMKQYFEIKNEYKEYILFYRLGDFYEMFFEDAVTASRELELTLTGRNAGLEERAPLCGVPYHSADAYIARLIEKGYKVAICEQTEDPAKAKGLVRREVVRIVTPGTLTDPELLDRTRNNFLLSIHREGDKAALVYGDVSTFEIHARIVPFGDRETDGFDAEIRKIAPSEILSHDPDIISRLPQCGNASDAFLTQLPERYFQADRALERILEVYRVPSILPLGMDRNSPLVPALGALLEYIMETQKSKLSHFALPAITHDHQILQLDQASVSNLELVRTLRTHELKGSLLWVLDRTRTAMGARMMKKWILNPLRDMDRIVKRQEAVQSLVANPMVRDDLSRLLQQVYDLERLVSKLIYGQVLPKDLNAIARSLEVIPGIIASLDLLDMPIWRSTISDIDPCKDLVEAIRLAIVEEPPALMKDGGYIRPDYSAELMELKHLLTDSRKILLDIENRERELTGIKNLKVKYNKVFGYYLEVTNSHRERVPDRYVRKQTLANAERYITEELKDLESRILSANEHMLQLEQEIYAQLREMLGDAASRMLATAQELSRIDVLCSLAQVAFLNHYVCPVFNDEGKIQVVSGRHPVVEKIVGRERFIDNDVLMDASDHQFHIITGPNMAGKSTYLRQVALIAVMAQIGSFVPAEYAELPLFDRIFTRVGASDDLAQGQSTFMVEMSELAAILRHCSDDSLVLLDEIGRGTSTYDGLSIAWAVVEYLTESGQANPKTLFATHYHELTELEGKIDRVKNFHITVEETGGDILFLRKIARGSAKQSYGIQVAKLAGVPGKVLINAKRILHELEQTDIARVPKIQEDPYQVSFFREDACETLLDALRSIKIDETTPLDALKHLAHLKEMAENGGEPR